MDSPADLDWRTLHRDATVVDLHVHPSLQQQLFQRNLNWRHVISRLNPLSVRSSFPRLKTGGFDAILSVVYAPEKGILGDFPILNVGRLLPGLWNKLFGAPPFNVALRMLDDMERAVAQSAPPARMQMARSLTELNEILGRPGDDKPIAVVHCVEGAHALVGADDGEAAVLRNLETFYQRGVCYLTLAHFYPNVVASPCFPFPEDLLPLAANPDVWRDLTEGLTATGRHVVERMIELGMLIDLSHATPVARRQIYDIIDASGKRVPLMFTHVGVYAINPSPYNPTDEEIRRIARDGGVIGVIFMPYWLMPKETKQGINFISATIRHLYNVGGEDCVGIGTDFDGFTTPPDDLIDASQMPRLTQRLLIDGYTHAQIRKFLGGNALRALRAGWGKTG